MKKNSAAVAPFPPPSQPNVRVEGPADDNNLIRAPELDFAGVLEFVLKDQKVFKDPVVKSDFVQFAKRLSLSNQLKLFFRFEDWQDSYDEIDPDGNHPDVRSLSMEMKNRIRDARYSASDLFLQKLWAVLKKAEFDLLAHEHLNQALEETAEMGLKVIPPDPRRYSVWCFVRGREMGREYERSFKRCFRESVKEFEVYDRVLVVFRVEDERKWFMDQMAAEKAARLKTAYDNRVLKEESSEEERQAVEREISESVREKYEKELKDMRMKDMQGKLELKSAKVRKLEQSLQPGFLYLKYFKDVSAVDLDMMIPQTEIALSLLDILMVVIPILIGIVTTIAKIFRGGLNFDGPQNAIQSIIVCLGPVVYGAKAYMTAMTKKEAYRNDMTNLYRLHNVSNNASVVSTLLEEAHEMDDMEALLAYFTLFAAGRPLTRGEVDSMSEARMRELSGDPGLAVDFDVNDALEKLRDFGLVKIQGDRLQNPEGCKYECLPLVEALKRVSEPLNFFPRDIPVDAEWSNCSQMDENTGQLLRYRFNRRTKQSVPDS